MEVLLKELMWEIFDIWSFVHNMLWSITVVITVVIISRFFIKQISKLACYCLWLIVAIRLICPITIESELSIFNLLEKPQVTSIVDDTKFSEQADLSGNKNDKTIFEEWDGISNEKPSGVSQSVISRVEITENDIVTEDSVNTDAIYISAKNFKFEPDYVKCAIWLLGVWSMLLYGIASYKILRRRLRFATKNENGYFESEEIASPFVLGIFKPVIYLPCYLRKEEKQYILLHERYHIKRLDYLVKIFAFGLLCVYWFHPFVWIAFYLMSQDMETSCDEQILKNLSGLERKTYSTLLLSFATGKRFPLPAPLCFGENNVKKRIKQILSYKKPTKQALLVVVGMMLLVAVICLTDANNGGLNNGSQAELAENQEEHKTDSETGRLTDEYLSELSEKLFEAKNAYIGNAPGNGTLIKYLVEALDITDTNGMELQTTQEPYWLTLRFDEKPDNAKMFQLSAMFLALVDNASEFRWEFPNQQIDEMCVYYVDVTLVNKLLADNPDYSIKKLTDSPQSIAKLWRSLEDIKEQYESWMGCSELIGRSNWENFAQKFGFDFIETNKWKNRFIEDDLIYIESDDTPLHVAEITTCIYEDLDESGVPDMVLLLTYYSGQQRGSRLIFYMNDSKHYTYGSGSMNRCFDLDIKSGDIDHDGALEFVFIGRTTGVSGSVGNYCKDIFKYKDGSFWDIELPGDYEVRNFLREMGYDIEVYWGEKIDTYDVYCPTLNVTKTIYSPYLRDEKGKLYGEPTQGELVGSNDGGFYTFEIAEIDGKDYLVGTEVVIGDGGTSHCLADARFVLDWDEEAGWFIKDFDVISFDYERDSKSILETMKQSLKYLPTDYDAIIAEEIPMIDYKKDELIESYDAFSDFARRCYAGYENEFTYAIWNANEEPIFASVLFKDGIYYYLEDYSNLIFKPNEDLDYKFTTYSNEIYTVQKIADGRYVEYFYLTNEENLTLEELQESLLSSETARRYEMIPIYHKVLDEDGFGKYMETTGNILDLGIRLQLPKDSHWIQNPSYAVFKEADYEKPMAKVEYYDGKIFSDMTLLVGSKADVFKNLDITAYLELFSPESWASSTIGGEYLPIDFYIMPIDDIYKMTAAIWEYEENTYVIYGKTAAKDCSFVAKVAAHIIEYLE